jgi:hypothetical protein
LPLAGAVILNFLMRIKSLSIPVFFIDSLPELKNIHCKELLRHIEIKATRSEIFTWLKQLRVAPYSYDFIDNRFRESPDYIIENLPPLKVNTHFLLAFHIYAFREDSFIAGRFCQPINPPLNLYMNDMFVEYRIAEQGSETMLWCKIKAFINSGLSSKGFFAIFSVANKIMMTKQIRKIKKLSERLSTGKIKRGIFDLKNYHPKSGIHWWIFCRRQNCKGLIT